jgi:hypothetical protein
VVVNESDDVHVAGDVQVYRNATDMSHQLEHWYVDVPHLALDGLGRRAVLGSTGDRIIIERLEDYADGRALLQTWLLSTARSRQAARAERARRKHFVLGAAETSGTLPTTIEGLIAYVGFRPSR